MPVRPIVLDTALNHIKYPPLQHRLPAKEQSTLQGSLRAGVGRFLGWGGG